MGTSGRQSRIARLDELRELLAQRDYTTVADLAEDLGVSVRTLHRDLALLRDLGMPIESDRGRGGGLRLEQGWSLGRVHLNESEAIGLLLSLTIAERIGSPLLLGDLRSVRRKVGAAFAPAQARRIMALRSRILVGQAASPAVLSSTRAPLAGVVEPLLQAFLHRRLAEMHYEGPDGHVTRRHVEAQYLYYNVPVWYLLAWDHLRADVRSFRIDRIKKLVVGSAEFRLRRADEFLAAGEAGARAM